MIEVMDRINSLSVQKTREITPVMRTPDEAVDKYRVTVRLIEILLDMPEEDQRNMLKILESDLAQKQDVPENKKTSPKDFREHPRKTSLIAVDCSTHDICFTNFIHDISNGGVFIETHAPFYVGQKIALNFSLPEPEGPISIGSEVIRINSNGIGVKFIEGDVHKIDIKT